MGCVNSKNADTYGTGAEISKSRHQQISTTNPPTNTDHNDHSVHSNTSSPASTSSRASSWDISTVHGPILVDSLITSGTPAKLSSPTTYSTLGSLLPASPSPLGLSKRLRSPSILGTPILDTPIQAVQSNTQRLHVTRIDGVTFVNQYLVIQYLGRGTSGKVFLCMDVEERRLYAVKIVKKTSLIPAESPPTTPTLMNNAHTEYDAGGITTPAPSLPNNNNNDNNRISTASMRKSRPTPLPTASSHGKIRRIKRDPLLDLQKEIAIMRDLSSHPNIVSLKEVVDDATAAKMLIVMEYCEGGPVLTRNSLDRGRKIPEEVARGYMRDMIAALDYLHSKCIVHGDLKPENVLMLARGRVALSDFGCSKRFDPGDGHGEGGGYLDTCNGTPAFLAPEMMKPRAKYRGPPVDVYSLGACLYTFIYGRIPFTAQSIAELFQVVPVQELEFPDTPRTSPVLKDILENMLEKNPEHRLTLGEAAGHPWITDNGRLPPVNVVAPSSLKKKKEHRTPQNIHRHPHGIPPQQTSARTSDASPETDQADELLSKLLQDDLKVVTYTQGQCIYRQGERRKELLFILQGSVDVVHKAVPSDEEAAKKRNEEATSEPRLVGPHPIGNSSAGHHCDHGHKSDQERGVVHGGGSMMQDSYQRNLQQQEQHPSTHIDRHAGDIEVIEVEPWEHGESHHTKNPLGNGASYNNYYNNNQEEGQKEDQNSSNSAIKPSTPNDKVSFSVVTGDASSSQSASRDASTPTILLKRKNSLVPPLSSPPHVWPAAHRIFDLQSARQNENDDDDTKDADGVDSIRTMDAPSADNNEYIRRDNESIDGASIDISRRHSRSLASEHSFHLSLGPAISSSSASYLAHHSSLESMRRLESSLTIHEEYTNAATNIIGTASTATNVQEDDEHGADRLVGRGHFYNIGLESMATTPGGGATPASITPLTSARLSQNRTSAVRDDAAVAGMHAKHGDGILGVSVGRGTGSNPQHELDVALDSMMNHHPKRKFSTITAHPLLGTPEASMSFKQEENDAVPVEHHGVTKVHQCVAPSVLDCASGRDENARTTDVATANAMHQDASRSKVPALAVHTVQQPHGGSGKSERNDTTAAAMPVKSDDYVPPGVVSAARSAVQVTSDLRYDAASGSTKGNEYLLAVRGPGEFFGEMALIGGSHVRRSDSVFAKSDTVTIAVIPYSRAKEHLRAHPVAKQRVAEMVWARQSETIVLESMLKLASLRQGLDKKQNE